jgi:hypothetical protein
MSFALPLPDKFPHREPRPTKIFSAKSTAKTGKSTYLSNSVMSNTSDKNTIYGMTLRF